MVRRIPWTIYLAIVALFVYLAPVLTSGLQFDRIAIQDGQLWRLITGHFTHWNGEHLFWDLAVFVVLGVTSEWQSRRAWMMTVACSAAIISGVIWFGRPDLEMYRGLSGIDSALFVQVLVGTGLQFAQRRKWLGTFATVVLLLGLLGKIVFEVVTGTCLFVDPIEANFVPLPLAHLAGAIIGLGGCRHCWRRKDTQQVPPYATAGDSLLTSS